MKRVLLVLALGLAVGTSTHFAYYRWHATAAGDPLDQRLGWMRTELQLTDAQYARIKALHQSSSPQLQALATQVAQMRSEFAAFETTRRNRDRVDFVEFARFVEMRRQINRACSASTRQLVLAAAEIMTPAQRSRYLDLLAAAGPAGRTLLN